MLPRSDVDQLSDTTHAPLVSMARYRRQGDPTCATGQQIDAGGGGELVASWLDREKHDRPPPPSMGSEAM